MYPWSTTTKRPSMTISLRPDGSFRCLPALERARVASRRSRVGVPAYVFLVALLAVALPVGAQAQAMGSVSGRIVDDATGQPISEAIVRIVGTDIEVLTGETGAFTLSMIPAGEQQLRLEHLAYGEHTRSVLVERDGELRFEVRLSQRAIELEPLVVETLSDLDQRRVSTGFAMNEVLVDEIDHAARTGQTLSELLRDRLPGAFVRGSCLEGRGITGLSRCREVRIVLDGIPISSPGTLLTTMPISNIERLELLSVGEAGARYGSLGGNGVLLIETKTGRRPDRALDEETRLTGFDWSAETEPYPWPKVFGSAFLLNAVGMGASYLLYKDCFELTGESSLGLRTKCDGFKTTASGFVSLGMPNLAGSFAARWAGSTARSRGRLLPMAIGAMLTSMSGYLLVIYGQPAAEVAGGVVLALGVPAFITLSDRVFRTLR